MATNGSALHVCNDPMPIHRIEMLIQDIASDALLDVWEQMQKILTRHPHITAGQRLEIIDRTREHIRDLVREK